MFVFNVIANCYSADDLCSVYRRRHQPGKLQNR